MYLIQYGKESKKNVLEYFRKFSVRRYSNYSFFERQMFSIVTASYNKEKIH